MHDSILLQQQYRDRRGRFIRGRSGNPAGRPPGLRNRATLAAEQMLDGEAERLTRLALDLAHDGDKTALRLCLDRIIAPRRERAVSFTMPPIAGPADLAIHSCVSSGRRGISGIEGASLPNWREPRGRAAWDEGPGLGSAAGHNPALFLRNGYHCGIRIIDDDIWVTPR